MGVASKLKGLLCQLEPVISPLLGFFHPRPHCRQLVLEARSIPQILFILDKLAEAQLGEIVELFLRIVDCLLLCLIYLRPVHNLLVVPFSDYGESPILELRQNGKSFKLLLDPLVYLVGIRIVPLRAFLRRSPRTSAVVQNIVLKLVGFLDELLFEGCRNNPAAIAADDLTRICVLVSVWSWLSFSTENKLHRIKLLKRYHRFVLALEYE